MIYILNDEAGKEILHIRGELHKYLIKVRRHKEGDVIGFRSRKDIKILYSYKIDSVEPRSVDLTLISLKEEEVKSKRYLHIGWCLIDPNSVEKVLPSLCEIGVEKISFISCERSQKNFKIDLKRFERILESSMQQCGRTTYIEFDMYKNIKEFLIAYPDTKVFDFCENVLEDTFDFKTVLIGCEGGFSQGEKELLKHQNVFRLNTPMVLRSESAVVAVASKIVL